MTKEEAIKWLKQIPDRYIHGGDEAYDEKRRKAIEMAIDALRAQQEKLDRSRWEGCINCTMPRSKQARKNLGYQYCEHCGRPLTEEAWAGLERRINGGAVD